MSDVAIRPNDAWSDIATIAAIDAVPTILEVVCRTTGMGFAAVARVTEDRWIACGVRDEINFGLKAGGELKVETTICDAVRESGVPTIIDDVAKDMIFCGHPTPALYGFQSYVSMPITMPDGRFFGTLCAIDPRPHRVNTPEVIGMFRMFAQLIGFHIDAHDKAAASAKVGALNEMLTSEVAERTHERDETWRVSQDMLIVLGRDGVIRSVNPAWTRTLGYQANELVGRPISDFLNPSHDGSPFERTSERAEAHVFETCFRHRDGSWRDLAWTAASSGANVYGVARDVTEEKARADALLLHENITQSSVAPICAFDSDFRLIAFNQAHSDEFFRIYGYRVQVGDVFPDLFAPDQAPVMRALMARALTGEAFSVEEEFGDPAIVKPCWEIHYAPLRDARGQIMGAFHLARDVSDRLRTQAELAAAQEALRQSQKMEAVGQLTGGVAHDFNNLLTVIKSSTDLLKRPDLKEERRLRYVEAISDTVDRAAKLTGQLLAFARRQALRPEVFDVGQSVRQLADMTNTLTGSRISIVTKVPDAPCFIDADPSQFDTAIINMVVNARDAMDGRGQLTVEVREVSQMPASRAHAVVEATFVAVSLTDTGTGIPAEALERIFEPFFTTKGVGKGTGLGLSQVYGFAKQSGGEVMVESQVGKGSNFTLYLPEVTAPTDVVAESEPEPLVDGHGTRVLVVEDNQDVGTFTTQTLAELGYVTVWAPDAEHALQRLAESADHFDIVFSDVVMPGMGGIELGQEVRRLYPSLPVVLTSGYSHVLAQNGTYGFELLHKPYSVEQLSRVLRKAASWQRRKRLLSR